MAIYTLSTNTSTASVVNGDTVVLPSTTILPSTYTAQITLAAGTSLVNLVPFSGQTVMGLVGNHTQAGALNARILLLTFSGSNWTIQISDDSLATVSPASVLPAILGGTGVATGGTVTSVSSGTLSPLFTSSVATSTTTPAISYSLTSAASGTLFGVSGSATAAPGFIAPGTANQLVGIKSTGNGIEYKSIVAGSNITVTPTAGQISIATTGLSIGDGPLLSGFHLYKPLNGTTAIGSGFYSATQGILNISGQLDGGAVLFAKQVTGDFTLITRVVTWFGLPFTSNYCTARICAMDGLTNASPITAAVGAIVHGSAGRFYVYRTTVNGSDNFTESGSVAANLWLKLVRSGNSWTSFFSTDGASWVAAMSAQTITPAADPYVGFACGSADTNSLGTSTAPIVYASFDNITLSQP